MPTHFAGPEAGLQTGLLEQSSLRLSPPDEAGRRQLSDDAGQLVGVADVVRGRWGWGWSLLVREAFEEPVVFRIRRAWTLRRRWLVEDAEGEEVGIVGGPLVLNRWGHVVFRRTDGGRAFTLTGGDAAAEWAADAGRLTLRPVVCDDPFWKMLLLAAVLMG